MDTLIYWGKVENGKKRGKKIGFPTANIRLHKLLSEGVYASIVTVMGKKHIAATFIGKAKTFNETDYKSESYILDFNSDIYKKWITVRLFKKIRGNQKFTTVNALIKQIKKDVLATRKFFGQI